METIFLPAITLIFILMTIYCLSYSKSKTLKTVFSLNIIMPLLIPFILIFNNSFLNFPEMSDLNKIRFLNNGAVSATLPHFKEKELTDLVINNKDKILSTYNKNIKEKRKDLDIMSTLLKKDFVLLSKNNCNKDIDLNIVKESIILDICGSKNSINIKESTKPEYLDLGIAIFDNYYIVNQCNIEPAKYCKLFNKNKKELNKSFEKIYEMIVNIIILMSIYYLLLTTTIIFYINDKKGKVLEEKKVMFISALSLALITILFYFIFEEVLDQANLKDSNLFTYIEKKTQWILSLLALFTLLFPFIIKHLTFKLKISYSGGRNRILIFKKDNLWCYCYHYDNRVAHYINEKGIKDNFTYQELKRQDFVFEKELYIVSDNAIYCPFETIKDEKRFKCYIYPENTKGLRYLGKKST
jgi:hypothetical protein